MKEAVTPGVPSHPPALCARVAAYPEDDEVEQPIDARPLELGLSRVLHEFRVLACEDDDAVGPLGVAQDGAAQEDALVVQRVALALPRQGPLKAGQVVVRRLGHDVTVELPCPLQ